MEEISLKSTDHKKLITFLSNKIEDIVKISKKEKKKYKIRKTIYTTTVCLSAILTSVVACTSLLQPISTIAIINCAMSSASALLITLSTKFDMENKKYQCRNRLWKVNKLKEILNFVVSCNGNLNASDEEKLMKEIVSINES